MTFKVTDNEYGRLS